eukprot:2676280-Pleurochrysis_carterae.AAC.2
MLLKRSRNSGVICPGAQMPPGRISAAWLRVAAAEGGRHQVLDGRIPRRELADARHVESCLTCPRSELLLSHALDNELERAVVTDADEVTACLKKAIAVVHIVGNTSRMCASRPIAPQHPERRLADDGHRAHRRHGALGAEASEGRTAQLPASLAARSASSSSR